ncbi:MAG: hypothetical protein K6E14_11365 [Paludibacteraceae bacterium]|nr:hypothetical protein [Paludibacteraceae bacterium]
MKGTIRISVEPEDVITLLESNINELSFQQKKFLMNMIAASMTNKTEWEVCDEVDGLIDRIK